MTYNFNNSSQDHINGLRLVWLNTEDIRIEVGQCRDSTNTVDMVNGANITVQIDASAGANALDGEAGEAFSTWYHVFLISGAGQTTAGLLNVDGVPTMPSGYTHKRHIGWVYNHTDPGNLQTFDQTGTGRERTYYWAEAPADYIRVVNNVNQTGSYATVVCSSLVPTTASSFFMRLAATGGGNSAIDIQAVDGLAGVNDITRVTQNAANYQIVEIPCPDTKSFKYECNGAATLQALVLGWRETL